MKFDPRTVAIGSGGFLGYYTSSGLQDDPVGTVLNTGIGVATGAFLKIPEFDLKEINRAIRFKQQNPHTKPLFPLIEKRITKQDALGILWKSGIEIPVMYKLGYNNNNCIAILSVCNSFRNTITRSCRS